MLSQIGALLWEYWHDVVQLHGLQCCHSIDTTLRTNIMLQHSHNVQTTLWQYYRITQFSMLPQHCCLSIVRTLRADQSTTLYNVVKFHYFRCCHNVATTLQESEITFSIFRINLQTVILTYFNW